MSLKKLAVAVMAGIALVVGFTPSAQAGGQDATINNDEFVFFYNSNYAGSYSDFATKKANLAGYTFLKPGLAGSGSLVKNNAASVANYRGVVARVYFNSDFGGSYDGVAAESGRNLVKTYNDNASFQWGPF